MPDKQIVPILIGMVVGILALAGGGLYIIIFAFIPGGIVVQILMGGITLAMIVALAMVVRARLRELKEENPDDYRNY